MAISLVLVWVVVPFLHGLSPCHGADGHHDSCRDHDHAAGVLYDVAAHAGQDGHETHEATPAPSCLCPCPCHAPAAVTELANDDQILALERTSSGRATRGLPLGFGEPAIPPPRT